MYWPSPDANGIVLRDPVSVRYQSVVVVFARAAQTPTSKLYYNIRVESVNDESDYGAYTGWYEADLTQTSDSDSIGGYSLPLELRTLGMSLITVSPVAMSPSPADAPFRVVSDDKYLYVYRVSTDGTLYLNRFVLIEVPAQPDIPGSAAKPTSSAYVLQPAWELRYQRSGLRDTPAGPDDVLAYRDMNGRAFIEPTFAFGSLPPITAGNFTVLLLPDAQAQTARWQFFVADPRASTVSAISYAQGDDGLIDFSDSDNGRFVFTPLVRTTASPALALSLSGGVSATLYGQQEPKDPSDPDSDTLRRAAHVLLALPVSASSVGLSAALACFDFSLGVTGTLAAVPANTACIALDGTLSATSFTPFPLENYPVPHEAITVVGTSTISATLLGQVKPESTPFLLDGGDGLVHCYYPGPPDIEGKKPFLVAQFSPFATRSVASASWIAGSEQGQIDFVVSRTGTTTTGLSVTITPAGSGPLSDFCNLTIDYGPASGIGQETFTGVPRKLSSFLAVVNGAASSIASQNSVLTGVTLFFDYSGTRSIVPLPLGSATAPTGSLLLVSARPDIALTQATLSANGALLDLVLNFKAGGITLTQTWLGLPKDPAMARVILNGDAAPTTCGYAPAASDTKAIALSTTGGTILLFLQPNATASITVSAASSGHADEVNVTLLGSTLVNVPSEQLAFITALEQIPGFSLSFSVVSPEPVPGALLPQQSSGALNLRQLSLLLDVIPPTSLDRLVASSVSGSPFQAHTEKAPQVSVPLPDHMVAMEAIAVTQPDNGLTATVRDGTYSSSETPSNGEWLATTPLYALELGGQAYVSVPTSGPNFGVLAPGKGLTLEAWVKPSSGSPASVFTFDSGTASPCDIQPSYVLGVTGQSCIQFGPYTSTTQQFGAYVEVSSYPGFDPASGSFTWEAWVKPTNNATAPGTLGSVIQVYDPNDPAVVPFELALDSALHPVVRYTLDGQTNVSLLAASALTPDIWTHLAVSAWNQDGAFEFKIYVNAECVVTSAPNVKAQGSTEPPLAYLGGSSGAMDSSFAGSLAEVRFWQACRSRPEIERTLFTTLQGTEPGLVGYWLLVEDPSTSVMHNACILTGPELDGTAHASGEQTLRASADGTFLALTVGMAGAPAFTAAAFLRADHWNHIAAVYEAGPALALNPAKSFNAGRLDYADCGNSPQFDFTNAMSVDAWVQFCDPIAAPQTLLSKWDAELAGQSYWFGLNAQGKLTVELVLSIQGESAPFVFGPFSFGPSLADAQAHHVAFTYVSTTGTSTSSSSTAGDTTPIMTTVGTLTLYVDGVAVGGKQTAVYVTPVSAVPLQVGKSPVRIGVAALSDTPSRVIAIESNQFFRGSLTGVRLWSVALSALQVKQAMAKARAYQGPGAVSAWWFDEQQDIVAKDSISKNDARLSNSDFWGPFPRLSTVTCYANGMQLGVSTPLEQNPVGYLDGSSQLTIGGALETGALALPWRGQLDELRIWNVARSQAQILDTMYTPLVGEADLVGYWTFDGRTANDQTIYKNDGLLLGNPPPQFPLSTAPVANEGPRVRNIYGGQPTDFQTTLLGTPAVLEYGDASLSPTGRASAVLKRSYAYASDQVTIEPGFFVGMLDLIYLGQVQTDATLLGYIEGAPPVPSENLSRPFYSTTAAGYTGYFNASSVTLREADSTALLFSSSTTTSIVPFDIAASLGFNLSEKAGEDEFVWLEFASVELQVGAKYKGTLTLGDATGLSYSSQWITSISDALGLRGNWEPPQTDPNQYVNPTVGRRFLPDNTGYALVTSLTADLYVMMLRQTGAMVGRVTIPNPDIPPDKNIVSFQIDPQYVKNGTLDGKVGLMNDTTYKDNADFVRDLSYFKPREAYRLKDRIEREHLAIKTFYAQFDAVQMGKGQNTDLSGVERQQFVAFGGDTRVARQSLVNSYVWTASGGLHAEQEQFSAQRVSSHSGSFKMSNTAGVTSSLKTGSLGLFAAVDFLSGQQIDVTVTKQETDDTSFGLSVEVPGESLLLGYDPELNQKAGGYTKDPCPGKVNGYRFYTFYLAQSTDNADVFKSTVVDSNWLRSNDPNAVTLRSAKIDKQSVWRVLHRVTYVNRVPPPYGTRPAQRVSSEPDRHISVEDNAELVAWVQEGLGLLLPLPANLADALTAILQPASGPARISALLPWWPAFLAKTRGSAPDPAAIQLMTSIFNQSLSYFLTGYDTGALPV